MPSTVKMRRPPSMPSTSVSVAPSVRATPPGTSTMSATCACGTYGEPSSAAVATTDPSARPAASSVPASAGATTAACSTIGPGAAALPELLEQEHEVDLGAAEPTLVFRHEHAEHTHPTEMGPQLGVVPAAALPCRADVRRRALLGEEVAQALGEELLVVGEGEAHQRPRGSCRTRSAMMLRWISLVPA